MKKVFLALLLILSAQGRLMAGHPDEGMWIPLLLGQLNEADMKARGLKLSAEDIYSANNSSLKDAVISFGGFCTGEVVSSEGLIFTNHHCGFDAIQTHSTTEHNYIKDGFWAMSRAEEIPNPGLTATFIIRIEDVTAKVLKNVKAGMSEGERGAAISASMNEIRAEAVKGTHYTADIRPFFYGNEYYMFVMETFRDVRLVGAPPSSIGNFGGDTDNWAWPRHTGDFSVFRIYAGADNKPADYSPSNVPFKPRHFFPISIRGVKEGDYTMVYGFPGRTTEYLSSFAVEQQLTLINPARISLRRQVLDIIQADMAADEKVGIQYASKEAGISNYWKKWSGESRGLKKANALARKQEFETRFTQWVSESRERGEKYGTLLTDLKKNYDALAPFAKWRDYWGECIVRAEILVVANSWKDLVVAAGKEDVTTEEINKIKERIKGSMEEFYKDFNAPTDKKLLAAMMKRFWADMDPAMRPQAVTDAYNACGGNWDKFASDVFAVSIFADAAKANAFLDKFTVKSVKKLNADPAWKLASGCLEYYLANVRDKVMSFQGEIDKLNRTYMAAQREMLTDKKFYPDANGTLRVTFGQVDDYKPADGVRYTWYTTMDGIAEKFIQDDVDFHAPEKLLQLHKNRDYGRYAENGVMHVCFTASNHTTGGNSGSPVLDAEGNLIGTNFDRNWEGTMSDIMYDPTQCRNITVDARYVLFIIDKFAGAGYLLKEMKIVE